MINGSEKFLKIKQLVKTNSSNTFFSFFLVLILVLLVFPVAPVVIDFGLSISFSVSFLILIVSVFVSNSSEFSSFPTLLLSTTLLRLGLGVATMRLILTGGFQGPDAAGRVISAFGSYLMRSDPIVGALIFSVLTFVNFTVITKGSGRISEVAARFSLDAMPGKQMAIDAELSSGVIDEQTAKRRREAVEEESAFCGTMDGAAKFVRGDAIAAIFIAGINIVGGLFIGVFRHGMSLADAVSSFTSLTVGDGLVSQIPALMISTASGMIVTKACVGEEKKPVQFQQLFLNPMPVLVVGVVCLLVAFSPGVPSTPFFVLGGGCLVLAFYNSRKSENEIHGDQVGKAFVASTDNSPQSDFHPRDAVDQIRLELGLELLGVANDVEGNFSNQIKLLRVGIARDTGVTIPQIRIQDNAKNKTDEYIIKIKDIEIGRGVVTPDALMVINPTGERLPFGGVATTEPAFGLPAEWIDPVFREEAMVRGYTIVDPAGVIITHLSEVVRDNLSEVFSYADAVKMLDNVSGAQQRLVQDLIPSMITVGAVQRVLQILLSERVSVRDIQSILEAINEACGLGCKGVEAVVAHVRVRLCRQLCASVTNSYGVVPVISLGEKWETLLHQHIVKSRDGGHIALPPSLMSEFFRVFQSHVENATGQFPILLVSDGIRRGTKFLLERVDSSISVFSYSEIAPRAKIRTISVI